MRKKLVYALELSWSKIDNVIPDHLIDPGRRLSRGSIHLISPSSVWTSGPNNKLTEYALTVLLTPSSYVR